MFIEANKLRVQTAQFDARLVGRKLPVDLGGADVSVAFPGGDFVREALPVVDPARQTLPSEHAQFAFGNVQPASVFRGVMNLQPFRQSPGFARNERFVERRGRMRIQVVHDQHDPIHGLVLFVQEVPQRVKVPDYAHLLPEPLRRFTTAKVYDAQHLSFIQGAGHGGSHPHLANEFISAIVENRQPFPNAVQSANWTLVGVLAHQSAMKGGRIMKLPEFALPGATA